MSSNGGQPGGGLRVAHLAEALFGLHTSFRDASMRRTWTHGDANVHYFCQLFYFESSVLQISESATAFFTSSTSIAIIIATSVGFLLDAYRIHSLGYFEGLASPAGSRIN